MSTPTEKKNYPVGDYDLSSCMSCRTTDTVLLQDKVSRLHFVSCNQCNHSRSVRNPFYKVIPCDKNDLRRGIAKLFKLPD